MMMRACKRQAEALTMSPVWSCGPGPYSAFKISSGWPTHSAVALSLFPCSQIDKGDNPLLNYDDDKLLH